jgi:insertion element IS1 protein InsB
MDIVLSFLFYTINLYRLEILSIKSVENEDTGICPKCGSTRTIKNGSTHHHQPKRKCKDCGRQFVLQPQKVWVEDEKKRLIDKLLLERISLAGIARVVDVSESWLQKYVNLKFASVPRQVKVSAKSKGKLILECDELWSFVTSKQNKVYVWLALDRKTREIVGCYIGDRTRKSAQKLWQSLPPVYRQCAVA